eukprot:11230215-Alexandrium_andersonii.AAC.1
MPQGCPWSMTILALAMTPWARYVAAQHPLSTPRLLADDMLVQTIDDGTYEQDGGMAEEHSSAVQSA